MSSRNHRLPEAASEGRILSEKRKYAGRKGKILEKEKKNGFFACDEGQKMIPYNREIPEGMIYMKKLIAVLCALVAGLLLAIVLLGLYNKKPQGAEPTTQTTQTVATTEATAAPTAVPTTQPPQTEPTETQPSFQPRMSANTDPANWHTEWEVLVGYNVVESYTREDPIFFDGDDYFALPGIATFRGSNYRTDASYGTADIETYAMTQLHEIRVGYITDLTWLGCGWTGQPLVVQWDNDTKQIMNLYEEKKDKAGLVEVIYAKMDGYVHFFDIEDGSATRDPIYLGMVFKGAGALDPRGYPLLYLGAGIEQGDRAQRIFVVSLIDGKVLYEYCPADMETYRWWFALDSSPLVDANADTLIYPCENGQIYTFKLNTVYDKENGTISVNPDPPARTRYTNDYHKRGRYIGYEGSVTAVENYLYIGDNGGSFQCVDANTMEVVWVQDLVDDVNATAVFEWGEDGRGYLYVGASTDYATNKSMPFYKLDAQTGEIIWEKHYACVFNDEHTGGIMGSPMLGREGTDLEGLLIVTVASYPTGWDSMVYAFDKETGEVVWEFETSNFTWCSPVGVYTEDGKGYIIQIDHDGVCYMLDGASGELMNSYELNVHVEASPVVFGNRLVIGTRESILLFELS